MKHRVLTESIELHPIGSCFSDNVGNSELRKILREYFGKNEISYTADYSNEIWGEVMQFLERNCKFIKDIELSSGLVSIYETDIVNEFLVRFELENGGRNFVFWRKVPLEDKVKAIYEHFQYKNYLHCIKCRLFTGTYNEYKERIKMGPIGYIQKV